MNKNELIKKIIGSKKLLDDYSVNRIGVFGSYARGTQTKKSDIDILVSFSQIPDLFGFADLKLKLEKKLKKKIDLGTEDSLKPLIKDQVMQEVVWIEIF